MTEQVMSWRVSDQVRRLDEWAWLLGHRWDFLPHGRQSPLCNCSQTQRWQAAPDGGIGDSEVLVLFPVMKVGRF